MRHPGVVVASEPEWRGPIRPTNRHGRSCHDILGEGHLRQVSQLLRQIGIMGNGTYLLGNGSELSLRSPSTTSYNGHCLGHRLRHGTAIVGSRIAALRLATEISPHG